MTNFPKLPMSTYVLALLALVWGVGRVAAAEDHGWPRQIDSPQGKILIYQPQIETFQDDKITARAAVSITPPGQTEPVFGAAWFEARVMTDRQARTVEILQVKVAKSKFPGATQEQAEGFARAVETEIPQWGMSLSLDRLLASLEVAQKEQAAAEKLNTQPPKIILSTTPALLIVLNGDPQLRPVESTRLMRVVNTPYVVVFDQSSKQYYLYTGSGWVSAGDMRNGPWSDATPPAEAAALVQQTSAGAPFAAPPGNQPPAALKPRIIVATEPTELIATDGPPVFTPLPGNDLLYVSNTPNDVFLDVASQQYFVLFSGRWYGAKSFAGPWVFVAPDKLPPAFARIPPGSVKGEVLAHVAGTQQAGDALVDAQLPQTATVKRSEAKLTVVYDGEPNFVVIEGTNMRYAVNTPAAVLYMDGSYYCCHDAVWFVAATPTGSWVVADRIPTEIRLIPPTCPIYNVRYVYIYDATPEVVYVGYTPGYLGCYTYSGVVVYGTGYWYRGWCGPVHYYSRPCTWGFDFHYVDVTGGWAFNFGYNSGGVAVDVNVGRGHHGWWGPGGYSYFAHNTVVVNNYIPVRPSPRLYAVDRRVINIYNRHQEVEIHNQPPQWREQPRPMVRHDQPNNLFVDREGNVLRRTNEGWQRHEGGGWSKPDPAPLPAHTLGANPGPRTELSAPRAGGGEHIRPALPNEASPQRNLPILPAAKEPQRNQPVEIHPPGSAPNGHPRNSDNRLQLEQEYQARQHGEQRADVFQRHGDGFGGGGSQPGGGPRSGGPQQGGSFQGGGPAQPQGGNSSSGGSPAGGRGGR